MSDDMRYWESAIALLWHCALHLYLPIHALDMPAATRALFRQHLCWPIGTHARVGRLFLLLRRSSVSPSAGTAVARFYTPFAHWQSAAEVVNDTITPVVQCQNSAQCSRSHRHRSKLFFNAGHAIPLPSLHSAAAALIASASLAKTHFMAAAKMKSSKAMTLFTSASNMPIISSD